MPLRAAYAALLLALVWLSRAAVADQVAAFSPTLPVKTRCLVAIEELHPTQFAVGYWEVDRRGEKIAGKSPKKLQAYMDEHLPLIVIGPGGVPYLIDGHHVSLALLKTGTATTVEARVEANWRNLDKEEFWRKMRQRDWVYLFDHEGKGPLNPEKLPHKLTEMADDPYRALAWEVRKQGGYEKTSGLFAEFRWANFFRGRVAVGHGTADFQRAIDAALKISHSAEAKDLPGYSPN